ncbi:hypothetical protein ACIBK8_09155 [Streptomyces sp. NPDC050161]|uniref:hypothetical protein n=1 Tax=Streptomyces sp. NPDC050161 TaxID=3365604 RepID=UPI00378CE09C
MWHIPGFTTPSPVPEMLGDRLVPQKITCTEEFEHICEGDCEGSWNPDCVQECIDGYCSGEQT